MAYVDTSIRIPNNATFTGPYIRTLQYVIGGTTVNVHAMVLQDPNTPTQIAAISAANALKVDGSAVTQPVSGSVSITGTATVAGTVAVSNFPATQPVSIAATLTTQFASAQNVINSLEVGSAYNGSTALTPMYAFANIGPSVTDGIVVAAVASKKIRVLGFILECGSAATSVTFNSKPVGAGTAISMQFQNGSYGGAVINGFQLGWFQTNTGEGLTVNTTVGSTTGIQVVYVLI